MRIRLSKSIALVVLLQLCAVADFSFFTPRSSLLHAQGLPLIRNYTAAEYKGHNRNYDIEIGKDGTVYVANFEGLLYYDRAHWRMIHTPDISRTTVVYRDSKDTIWVGGYNFLAHLQKQANGQLSLRQIGKDNQFKGEVAEIFEDEGLLQFVATDNNIYEIRGNTITLKKNTKAHFRIGVESKIVSMEALKKNAKDSTLDDITQTEELDDGLQVKVKRNNGLIITDKHGQELYTITEANGLCSNQVSYVAYDGHGVLWGATSHGIFSIEIPSVYSFFLSKDGLAGEVHAITAFDDKIYVGCTNGLYTVSSHQCKRIADINNICWELCKSRYGLLTATSSGIYLTVPGGNISRLTSNATTAMLVDGDKVYAGEPDGVYCYQLSGGPTQGWVGKPVSVNSLPLVTEIRKDAHGGLWFKNIHGETIGTAPNKTHAPIDELPRHLLMPLSDIEIKAQYRHGDQIWIGGDEVIAVIDTNKKHLATLNDSSAIRFCSIVMGSDSVLWGGYGTIPGELPKLDSDERNLHFSYALNYGPLTGKTLYRYRLVNGNIMSDHGHWSAWTEKQDVEFLNLPYGSFTLSVQAQLPNGKLSDVASIGFSIAYPLMMRWYMVTLYFILLGYMVYLMFQYRLKRLQKDKIKLERTVRERTIEVVKQKDEIVRQKDEIEEKSKRLEKALDNLNNAQHELIRQEKMATVGKLTEGLIDRILNPMNYIINFSKMSNDLLKDLKENIDNNKDNINEEDYEDTLDLLDMLTENLQNVDQYGQNTTRTLKAMEEMLKDRTGGYVGMDLLPVLQQDEEMVNNYFAKEKEQYHIRTVFTLPDSAMPLHGNPDMLSKTIMSILGNAIYAVIKKAQRNQYTPEMSLSVTIADGQYILKIHDNGVGIEKKILEKVFDPFFTTKTTGEAAGVGLYLSREIIQNHGGDISIASVKDEYTEVTITLPILKNENED